jgi:hypothetical protein
MTMAGEQPKQDAPSGGPDRLSDIQARIDGLTKLTQQYEAARIAGRRTRMGISIVILLIVLGFAAVLISTGYSFWNSEKERQEFLGELQAQMLSTQSGTLRETIDMVREVAPVYADEARKQFSEEWPNIQTKIRSESELLVTHLTEQGTAKIKSHLDKIAKGAEQRLKVEFKELANDQTLDTVMDNVQKALEGAVLDVFEGRAETARKRLMVVQAKTLDFLPPESRDTFVERMGKVWDRFLLYDVGIENKAHP